MRNSARLSFGLRAILLAAIFLLPRPGNATAPAQFVSVMDFGAAGNAQLGDQINDANDAPAFRAAIDAAVAAGHGNVYVPCGNYRLGASYGANWLILTDAHDGVHLYGDGDCSVLLPGARNGQHILQLCHDFDCNNTGETGPDDFLIGHLRFLDDDPIGHGHSASYAASIGNLQGEFIFNEILVFTGGARATFHSIRPDGSMWYMNVVGVPQRGTVAGTSGARAMWYSHKPPIVEESHGITHYVGERLTVQYTTFESIGDESVVLGIRARGTKVLHNEFINCPSIPSSGSCVDIAGATDSEIAFNTYDPGVSTGASRGNRAIDISSFAGFPTDGVYIHDEVIRDGCDPSAEPWECVDTGILLHSTSEHVFNVTIERSVVEILAENACDWMRVQSVRQVRHGGGRYPRQPEPHRKPADRRLSRRDREQYDSQLTKAEPDECIAAPRGGASTSRTT